jgi:hypothetical protein
VCLESAAVRAWLSALMIKIRYGGSRKRNSGCRNLFQLRYDAA